jgi:ribosomal protein L16 Arg81 hydroxylase
VPLPVLGYMLKRRIRLTYADREEILEAGHLFYLPPGHSPLVEEDTEFVEFSRPAGHQPVLDHYARAVAAASAT